jgi:hypothetical protein
MTLLPILLTFSVLVIPLRVGGFGAQSGTSSDIDPLGYTILALQVMYTLIAYNAQVLIFSNTFHSLVPEYVLCVLGDYHCHLSSDVWCHWCLPSIIACSFRTRIIPNLHLHSCIWWIWCGLAIRSSLHLGHLPTRLYSLPSKYDPRRSQQSIADFFPIILTL